jgi:hypothetical protein
MPRISNCLTPVVALGMGEIRRFKIVIRRRDAAIV